MKTKSDVTVWVVKHLRDLRSGKPETDVLLFGSEELARAYIARDHADFVPWPAPEEGEEDEPVTQWCLGDPDGYVDEYVELEDRTVDRGAGGHAVVIVQRDSATHPMVDQGGELDDLAPGVIPIELEEVRFRFTGALENLKRHSGIDEHDVLFTFEGRLHVANKLTALSDTWDPTTQTWRESSREVTRLVERMYGDSDGALEYLEGSGG